MIVRLNDDAKADAKSIDTWWRENRPHAPGLFVEGLKDVIALLKTAPNRRRAL